MQRKKLGQHGENFAQVFLCDMGFKLLHCNWRHGRHGEIDIIAYHPDKQQLTFIEVKTRQTTTFGHPLEALTEQQQHTIKQVAEAYLATEPTIPPFEHISFDLIVVIPNTHPPDITHYENAF